MVVPTTTTTAPPATYIGARVVLTLLGAAGLVIAAFLEWTDGIKGLDLSWTALYKTEFVTTDTIYKTVGGLSILLGLLLIVSLAALFGSLTRLVAALGIVMFVLFAIEIYRDSVSHDVQVGAWVSLGGSIVALIGGFVPARRTAAVATGPIAETEEP
jgi:O-antigen ligase